jgi:hypothetical protein
VPVITFKHLLVGYVINRIEEYVPPLVNPRFFPNGDSVKSAFG